MTSKVLLGLVSLVCVVSTFAGAQSCASNKAYDPFPDFDDDACTSVFAYDRPLFAGAEEGGEIWLRGFRGQDHCLSAWSSCIDPLGIVFLPSHRFAVLWKHLPGAGLFEEYDYSTGIIALHSVSTIPWPSGAMWAELEYDARTDRLHLIASHSKIYRFSSKLYGGSLSSASWHEGSAVLRYAIAHRGNCFLQFTRVRSENPALVHLALESAEPSHQSMEPGPVERLIIDEAPNRTLVWIAKSPEGRFVPGHVAFANGEVNAGQNQIRVLGFGPTAGSVVGEDGRRLGSYALTTGQTECLVTLTRATAIGETLSLVSSGGLVADKVSVMARWGTPNTTPSGMVCHPILLPENHHLGNANFQIYAFFRPRAMTTYRQRRVDACVVFVDHQRPWGGDPSVSEAEGLILNPLHALMWPAAAFVLIDEGRMGARMSTPAHPALVGQLLLYQFLIYDGAEAALSDIVGLPLLPDPR